MNSLLPQLNELKKGHTVHLNEKKLIQGLKERNEDAMKCLIDHFSSSLFGLIKRITADDKVAGEILETSFLHIINGISFYNQQNNSLFTWMSNITRNAALTYLGSKSIKRASLSISSDSIQNDILIGSAHEPDMIHLHKYIHQILPEHRVVWELSFVRKYSHEEISGLLRIPSGIVKTKIKDACMELLMLVDDK